MIAIWLFDRYANFMESVIDRSRLLKELETGIRGRLCVQAWLGYGEALFIGFGDEVLPLPLPGQRPLQPSYQLWTSLADWSVEEQSVICATLDSSWEEGELVCQRLVGRRTLDWKLDLDTWA